ncbi:pentatricopeptide repeat-containing protein At4g39530-like [Dendrobium catenatum]|uniref:Pentatricopeptide repeat-containing protein n=1 Tax=Dendrobium catenatum TaxID=906689 RepID=A0A2I0WTU8_9ASPA|nr:pentatricopeptide repeat-containing protein At4g39530-like [Dendrobium catenatum]PKU79092.1 Pentatricopeptide repeat-containing protein [Dendrobium catenatum]
MEAAVAAPSRSFIVSAIKSSIDQKFLSFGQSLHAIAVKIGFLPEILLCNHLINMYAKCDSLDNAHKVFDEMPERNLISYSTLVSSNSRSGSPRLALHLLSQLQSQAFCPNQFVFSSSIAACAKLNSLGFGQQIHAQVIASGFESDFFVSTTLVDMYSKFGELDLANSIFKKSEAKDPVLFNSMVSGYVSSGAHEEALLLFGDERKFGYFKPTEFSFGILIKACSDLNKEIGLQFHGLILKYGFNSNCFAGTSLVDLYGRLGHVESLEKAFEEILSCDIALYNAMIGGFSRNGLDLLALDCFSELLFEGFTPNECTLASALKSSALLRSHCWGSLIHGVGEKSKFSEHLIVKTALIDMYMKCGKTEESCSIFDSMIERNTVSYNSMIFGLGQNGYFDKAVRLSTEMKSLYIEVDPSTFVALMNSCLGQEWVVYGDAVKHGLGSDLMIRNALLSCLIKKSSAEEALGFFKKMKERNVVSWTTIISGLTQLDLHSNAIEVFKTMCSSEIFPNSFTFSSALKACGNLASIKQGRCVHASGIKYGVMDEYTNSSLLDMYAKCGVLEDSRRLFEEIGSEEIVSWNTMITAYAQHGRGREALEIYTMMQERNLEPNHVTFVSLLSACSHCGLLDVGIELFELMVSKHRIVPLMEHYACMVYLFGRAGFLDRAKLFIDGMPFEADASIWTVFLAACKLHGNSELAQLARKKLDGMLCEDNSTLVLVSNMFSEEGKWDEAEKERNKISWDGMGKEPGLSWVQIAEAFA